jgi:hypothetical protein
MADRVLTGHSYRVTLSKALTHHLGGQQWTIVRWQPPIVDSEYRYWASMQAEGGADSSSCGSWDIRATLQSRTTTPAQAATIAAAWLINVEGEDPSALDCILVLPDGTEATVEYTP